MSLTFPTAFWKTKAPEEGIEVNWTTNLWWSQPAGENNQYIGPPTNVNNFPFIVNGEEFYPTYPPATPFDSTSVDPYYGWVLHGNPQYYLSDYHRSDPWIVQNEGKEISLYYESDFGTAYSSGVEGGNDAIILEKYNSFIQSGDATGSFTLGSTKNLEIKVSGLAHDVFANRTLSCHYNSMLLFLYNGSSEELICSGSAPMDARWNENAYPLALEENLFGEIMDNVDMQQVKLYAGAALNTIVNYQKTPTVNASKGQPRSNSGEWVNELTRSTYCNTNGVGTFTKNNLAAGDYQFRLRSFTADGDVQSGAFYGFKFTFS